MDNVVLENGDGLKVTIATQPTDEVNYTKALTVIPTIEATGNKDTDPDSSNYGAGVPQILDLKRKVEKRITIDGFLVNGLGATDTNSTATLKKSDLLKIFEGGGVFNLTYEGSTFSVNSDKVSIKRVPTDNQTGEDGVAEYSVKITLLRGNDI